MKKTVVLVSMMLAFVTSTLADVGTVKWWASVGVYQHDPSSTSYSTYATDAILNNYDVLWQLILTPATSSAGIQAPDFSAANYLGADESLVMDKDGNPAVRLGGASYFANTFNSDASLYSSSSAYSMSCDLTVGESYYMYQRIYQLEKGQTVPTEDSWYWDSGVKEVKFDGKLNSVTFAVELDKDGNIDPNNMIFPNLKVASSVPEPATMSLLGLGALAMALRRKLRK